MPGKMDNKLRVARPQCIPHLQFPPALELKKYDQWLRLWSENGEHEKFKKILKSDGFFHLFGAGETGAGKSNLLEGFAKFEKDFHGKLIIDASGNAYEGCWWAKMYKCYFIYPQLLKPERKNQNPNVIELKLNKKNTWKNIIERAIRHKRIIVLMCQDPMEASYLRALVKLFEILLTSDFENIKKVCLLRELSFFAYKHGSLKLSDKNTAVTAKRRFLKFVRTGRIRCNQIFCDAQNLKDIDSVARDNMPILAIKRTSAHVKNYPKYIQDEIEKLERNHVIFDVKGNITTGTIGLTPFHKLEGEKIQDVLKVYPKEVELKRYNKLVENRYIDRVSEYYTNVLDRIVLARRRHLQDPENSELCQFEIADLLALETKLIINSGIQVDKRKTYLVYGEIKFRSADSSHPRIETRDVKKTISDLAIKKIHYDLEKKIYFWTIDKSIATQLNWEMREDETKVPVLVEMISPSGATKGAMALMKRHNIYNRIIKIEEETFFD